MNDLVVVLGLPMFSLTVPAFVLAGALAMFAYERAEARAARSDDLRWLLASMVLATVLGLVVEVRPVEGFRGLAWLVLQAIVGGAAVGLVELGVLAARRVGGRSSGAPTLRLGVGGGAETALQDPLRGRMTASSPCVPRSTPSNGFARLRSVSVCASRSSRRSRPRALRAYSAGTAATTARAARAAAP